MFNEYPEIMNVAQLAAALRIGKNSAYKLLHTHQIGYKKIGAKKFIIPKNCVIAYVQSARYIVENP